MSTTTNNSAAPTAVVPKEEQLPFMTQFNREGLKDLLIAYEHLAEYQRRVAACYCPMLFCAPRTVAPPTASEKSALDAMISKERRMIIRMKRMLTEMERSCDEFTAELGVSGWANTQWNNGGWGNGDDNSDGGHAD